MRRLFCWTFVVALLPAPLARAQYGFGFGYGAPGYGSYATTFGYGIPFGVRYGFGYGGFPYGGYYGGLGYGYGSGLGVGYYNSAYSVYAAPGATFSSVGTFGYPGVAQYGYPAFGLPGYGYGVGAVSGSYGYTATGPFMGLPQPNAGLIGVPR